MSLFDLEVGTFLLKKQAIRYPDVDMLIVGMSFLSHLTPRFAVSERSE